MGKINTKKVVILEAVSGFASSAVRGLACALMVGFFLGAAVVCSAQDERLIGGAGITVFADANFRGTTQTFQYDVPDLRSSGLDNRISSLRVGPGEQWEVCESRNYGGRCIVVSGQESNLRDNGWGDRISSMRRNSGGGGGGPADRPPSWAQGTWYWVQGYGRTMTIDSNGRITLYNDGRTSYGTYNRRGGTDTIFIDGVQSTISRNGNNIRTRNSATGEYSEYSRTNSGGGGPADRPPSWAQGTWYWLQGYGRRMVIDSNGRITLYNEGRTSYGTYNRRGGTDTIFIDGVQSTISRSGNNIRTHNAATGEYSEYSRTNSGGGGGNISKPPSWARGTWYWIEGPNRRMVIGSDGRITLYNQGRTSYGTYYNNTITIDGVTSTITRDGSRIRTVNRLTGERSTYRR